MKSRGLAVVCLIFSAMLFPEDNKAGPAVEVPWGSCVEVVGDNLIHTQSNPAYPDFTHNPDEGERQRLRIEWAEPAYLIRDRQEAAIQWVVWDPFGSTRKIEIHGKMVLKSVNGDTNEPIHWMQGIRVIVARFPGIRPDWSKQHDAKDAVWKDFTLKPDGTFVATFFPAEIYRPVGRTERFQCAVCLAIKSGQTITWKNTVPVLPQSVAMLEIPGPKSISPTLQIINSAPSIFDEEYNPVSLIRAVNHLQTLGKDKAIAALREFVRIAGDFSPFRSKRVQKRDPANIDTSDLQSAFYICRLLFKPASTNELSPQGLLKEIKHALKGFDQKLWPTFPLCLEADIPFLLKYEILMWPDRFDIGKLLKWAEQEGKMRTEPLRPGDDPAHAVDLLSKRPEVARLLEDGYSDPFEQAHRMITHLGDQPASAIFWSEEQQAYLAK